MIGNKEYFIYVWKEAIKALSEIATYEFNRLLMTEPFLIKSFKTSHIYFGANGTYTPLFIKYLAANCKEDLTSLKHHFDLQLNEDDLLHTLVQSGCLFTTVGLNQHTKN